MSTKPGIPVLVTGFGPYDSHEVNVSWEVAKILPTLNFESRGVQLNLKEIPVSYSIVSEEVPQLWKKYRPRLVVHLGMNPKGTEISLETIAHKKGYERPDIFGKLPPKGSANGKYDVISAGLNVKKVADELNNSPLIDVPIKVSTNAGRYLCEFVFYTSLNIDNSRTIFVHIPDTDKGFTLIQLALVLKEIILLFFDQVIHVTA